MATVIKTIGTTSRDYPTFTLWEGDLDDSAVYNAADDAVGDAFNDSAFDESFNLFEGTGLPLASITMTSASGERHDGTSGTGAGWVASDANRHMDVNPASGTVPYVCSFLEWDTNSQKLSTEIMEIKDGDITIANWLLYNADDTTSHAFGIEVRGGEGHAVRVINNIIYDIRGGGGNGKTEGIEFIINPTVTAYCSCNTVHNITTGSNQDARGIHVSVDDANLNLQNNLVTDAEDLCFDPASFTNVNSTNNMSSDATSSGTDSVDNVTTADQYVSTTLGSEDLRLKTGSDAINNGTDLGITPNGIEKDITGFDRDAGGVVWDIGANEFIAAVTRKAGRLSLLGVGHGT